MKDKICPICFNHAHFRLRKETTDYHECTSCGTLFSDPLDNSNMVGGGNELARNVEQNHLRIDRINRMCIQANKEAIRILDFGCGHGMLIKDLKYAGYVCSGYDAYNEQFDKLPEKGIYNIVTAIEVIEHTSAPFAEIDVIYRSLVPNGICMIETSFTNIAHQEGIEYEDFFYIDPKVGHSTIFSHHGLDVLMCLKGFRPIAHWNRHVRGFQKIAK